ncbi:MAG: 23S rRNA (uracil(1939)-C(5))-methyltransferase RlmD [Johnsonella sp.]|nr:23S rRNA (uracil(1939)-C(5))-methyltransferase RlmD [Johnsonella sp.]
MKKGEIAIGSIGMTKFPDKGYIEREDGRVLIKHAIPFQSVEYMVGRKKSGLAQGRVLRLVEKSRLEDNQDICIHAGECGGCLYQSMGYENQLWLKDRQMQELLLHLCKEDFLWEGILPSPKTLGYRNKMEFSFGDRCKGGELSLGMHKRGSHYDIVSIKDCKIVHPDFNKILSLTLEFFRERGIPYFHKNTRAGLLRHLLIRRAEHSKELLIDLVTTSSMGEIADPNRGDLPSASEREVEALCGEWKERVLALEKAGELEGKIAGILHTLNNSYADAVIDQGTSILYGRDYIFEKLLGLEFKISIFSFFQTNSSGAERLYKKAGDYIGDTKDKSVYDLYSGTGTIAQLLASVADRVYGIEIVPEAVQAARDNAERNGIKNCEFIEGDVLKMIHTLPEKADIVILDPPREGVHPKALQYIAGEIAPERMVYISCKPSSLARDLEELKEYGYEAVKGCAVDMFPYTPNVEVVVLLCRKDIDSHNIISIKKKIS